MASAFGVKFAPHVWASGVLFAATTHIAMSAPNCHIFEVSQSANPLIYELFEEPFDVRDGYVHAHDRPGLGFTLRKEVEQRFAFVHGPNNVY